MKNLDKKTPRAGASRYAPAGCNARCSAGIKAVAYLVAVDAISCLVSRERERGGRGG